MRSTCPSCLSQVEHANSESQVTCNSCGEVYSPFMTAAEQEKPVMENPLSDFSESSLAFQEIVNFGQGLDTVSSAPRAEMRSQPVESNPASILKSAEISMDFILSTADLGSHYAISQWFTPVSYMMNVGEDSDPLQKAWSELQGQATRLGANAIVGIRCSLCPDNKRVLVVGTPVRCQRKP